MEGKGMRCANCLHSQIYTDEEYCMRLVCRKTSKKGRTITWHMHSMDPYKNLFQYFADWCNTHRTPKWCPAEKEEENGNSFFGFDE